MQQGISMNKRKLAYGVAILAKGYAIVSEKS